MYVLSFHYPILSHLCSQSRVVAVAVVEVAGVAGVGAEAVVVVNLTSIVKPVKRASSTTFVLQMAHHPTLSDSDKKVHQSWGGDDGNTELKAEEAANDDVAAESAAASGWGADAPDADAWGAPTTDAGAASTPAAAEGERGGERRPRREREVEEEDNTLTLEQYLAQQKEKDSVVPTKLEGRKVEENWKDVVPLQKPEDDEYFVGKVNHPMPTFHF